MKRETTHKNLLSLKVALVVNRFWAEKHFIIEDIADSFFILQKYVAAIIRIAFQYGFLLYKYKPHFQKSFGFY